MWVWGVQARAYIVTSISHKPSTCDYFFNVWLFLLVVTIIGLCYPIPYLIQHAVGPDMVPLQSTPLHVFGEGSSKHGATCEINWRTQDIFTRNMKGSVIMISQWILPVAGKPLISHRPTQESCGANRGWTYPPPPPPHTHTHLPGPSNFWKQIRQLLHRISAKLNAKDLSFRLEVDMVILSIHGNSVSLSFSRWSVRFLNMNLLKRSNPDQTS